MNRYRRLASLVVVGLLAGLLIVPGAAAQRNVQLAMILDGSGSIIPDDWTLIINGLAAAVEDSACVPQDGSVELTVIQFSSVAQLEVGPVIIDSTNASTVASDIRGITQLNGNTSVACGFCLAQDVLLNHPAANYDPGAKQALNLVTDGAANECGDCADCTGDPTWTCPRSASCPDADASAVAARNHAISQLGMDVDPQDEIDAEAIGSVPDVPWLRDDIVWPQPGNIAPPFDPGWVRQVADAQEFADTICEKFQAIAPPVGGTTFASDVRDLMTPWVMAALAGLILAGGLAAVRVLALRRHRD